MKNTIENPKVFISYAWGDKEYENQVLAFASKLLEDGIDVVLDKWNLSEGNDTYAYMEQCVLDSTITNVLMLLDPIYAQKADQNAGGVGTETQIISAEVYNNTKQDKFIPVIMKRTEEGDICKPVYLRSTLHFDLTNPDDYDDTYIRLVKKLYGVEVYAKPELGKRPDWVDHSITVTHKTSISFANLKGNDSQSSKYEMFSEYLRGISNELVVFSRESDSTDISLDKYIELYDSSESIREKYLQLIKSSTYIDNGVKCISEFFEETKNLVVRGSGFKNEIAQIRLHEFFIYTIAFYLKNRDYKSTGYLLNKTYFDNRNLHGDQFANSFYMLYSRQNHSNLDNAIRRRDNKNYYSGTAEHWIETLDWDFCSEELFILADLICFNVSFYMCKKTDFYKWFPLMYVYDNTFDSVVEKFGKKLVSEEFALDVLPLFGYKNLSDLKKSFSELEKKPIENRKEYRYDSCFEAAHLIGDFIESEKIATLT